MLTDLLYENATSIPDRPFLIWENTSFSYAAMARMVSSYARNLVARGIREGDRVALICGNRPAFLIAWFALTEIGAVTVPLNTESIGDGLRYALEQSETSAILIEPELYRAKKAVLADFTGRAQLLFLDESLETDTEEPATRRRATASQASLNAILYTSGTTGLPKGAMISSGTYLKAGRDMVDSLELTREDRVLVFLPLFHANPQMYAVSSVLTCGACLIVLRKFSASNFFSIATTYRATGFTYVGTILSILDKSNPEPRKGHSLRWCVGGGAPAGVWKAVEERFALEVRELYGMTETGGWVTMNTSRRNRFGSVGSPRKGVTVRVIESGGNGAETGEKGEIVVSTHEPDLFFGGYWKKPDLTAQMIRDGWLHTGDRGWLDQDGFLYFDGRLKDLIRRGGEMISPTEIELQLLKHPDVRDCAIVGVEDEILGEEIKAIVVPHQKVDPSALVMFLSARLPPHMRPRYFSFVSQIPKTETQKIKRHELATLNDAVFDVRPNRDVGGTTPDAR